MKAKKKTTTGKKRGQKLKLDSMMITKIAELVAKGIPNKYACVQVGISEPTLYAYLAQAQELYDEKGILVKKEKDLTVEDRLMIELSKSLKRGKAEAVSRNLTMVQTAAINNWQAAAWWLERQDPEEFGRKDRVEATVSGHMTYEDRIRKLRRERGLPDDPSISIVVTKSLNMAPMTDEVENLSKAEDEPKKKSESFLERVKKQK